MIYKISVKSYSFLLGGNITKHTLHNGYIYNEEVVCST